MCSVLVCCYSVTVSCCSSPLYWTLISSCLFALDITVTITVCCCRSPSIEYYSGVDFPDSWDRKVLPPNRPSFNFSNFVCNLALVSTFCLFYLFVCLLFSRSHFLWHLWLLRPQTASATAHQTTSVQRPQFFNFVHIFSFFSSYVYFLHFIVVYK